LELKKHFIAQHFKIVALGGVEGGASNTVLFEPGTGKLTDQDRAKLKILGDAKVGSVFDPSSTPRWRFLF
ncbi:MAG TPA: hypothetical protein VER04_14635, partial [Polyangiaceae bacterium]|nr:hypothetical protein [Polyangiaceae bacterium]